MLSGSAVRSVCPAIVGLALLLASAPGVSAAPLLSDAGSRIFYDECARTTRPCGPVIQIERSTICDRNPNRYGSASQQFAPSRVWTRRRAVIAAWPSSGGFDVYTGSSTLTVYGVPRRQVRAFVDALRLVARQAATGPLARPRFARRDLRAIRTSPQLRAIADVLPLHSLTPDCRR